MQRDRTNAAIIALLLLWLSLTGGYEGRQHAALVAINGALALGLLLWLAWDTSTAAPDPLGLAVLGLVAVIGISAVINGVWYGINAAAQWLAYLGLYQLARRWDSAAIHRGAAWALLLYVPLGLAIGENSNVVAMGVLLLALLAAHRWMIAAVVGLLGLLGSVAGLLAVAAAYTRRRVALFAAPAVLIIGYVLSPGGYLYRLAFWREAAAVWLQNPWFGVGPGQFYAHNTVRGTYWIHAHNIVATTAAELGLVGLAALGLLAVAVWHHTAALPAWAVALLIAAAVWSLVDEPLLFWGPGGALMIGLSRANNETV